MSELRVPVSRFAAGAVGIRLVVVVLAAVATALVPRPGGLLVAGAVVGAVLAVAAPAFIGAFVLLFAEIAGWTSAYGTDADPAPLRTIAFAVVLYLAHSATALAASVPIGARVQLAVITQWGRRCAVPVAGAAIAGLAVALIGRLSASLVLDVVGLIGVVGALAALVWIGRWHR